MSIKEWLKERENEKRRKETEPRKVLIIAFGVGILLGILISSNVSKKKEKEILENVKKAPEKIKKSVVEVKDSILKKEKELEENLKS